MGSASGSLDSEDPSLSGSASGTPGDNGWYVSSVTVEASARDGGSRPAGLGGRGDGGWSGYGGPVMIGDGSHEVELRAVDVAGNTTSESFNLDIDTQSPIVDLFASPSFCPGCGEALDITIVAQDGGGGVARWGGGRGGDPAPPFALPSPTTLATGTTVGGGSAATRTPVPTRTPAIVIFGAPP